MVLGGRVVQEDNNVRGPVVVSPVRSGSGKIYSGPDLAKAALGNRFSRNRGEFENPIP
jgi:hypothetical protein